MLSIFRSKKYFQEQWKAKTIEYAEAVNVFIEKGLKDGWDSAGSEPKDNGREELVPHLIKAIKLANDSNELEALRNDWPLAHSPLIPILEKNGQSIPKVCFLEDGSIVARIGAPYESGYTVIIKNDQVSTLPNVDHFGRSPDRKYFAYTTKSGIRITNGWLGDEVCLCPYPKGDEGIPVGFKVDQFDKPPTPTSLIPFPDGKRVLYVSQEGIFVLEEKVAVRLLPTTGDMKEHFEWLNKEYPGDELSMNLEMDHGAISPCGKFIAIGSQDSQHLIFDDKYQLVADIGNQSEYPHHALFSKNSDMVAFNSCHFYNGVTVGVPTNLLPGLKTESYEEDERTPILDEGARVYAGTHRNDEFIIGDASGYLRAFSKKGEARWQHCIGSSIGDIDISEDGSKLVCTTYAGFISILNLDTGKSERYEIGNGGHTEIRRWLFWKDQDYPLAW